MTSESMRVLGSTYSMIGRAIKGVAEQIVGVQTATVSSSYALGAQTRVRLDSDPSRTSLPAPSISGRYQSGARVYVLTYPPRGLLVIGSVDSGRPGFTSTFTTPGANTWTRPSSPVAWAIVEVLSGGAAGGGVPVTIATTNAAGGGGQGGHYSRSVLPGSALPASGTINVGAGGIAVSAAGGGAGGASDFLGLVAAGPTQGGSVGVAAVFATANSAAGGQAAMTGMIGDLQVQGSDGGLGMKVVQNYARGGYGGPAAMGFGPLTRSSVNIGSAGLVGRQYGSGGSGAQADGAIGPFAGGNGFPGIVLVTYVFA